jgi:hypothetical protein
MIKIEDHEFKKSDIQRLYPAAMIKTGYDDELTPISLEWIESQKDNSDVIVVKYAIFIHSFNGSITPFFYKDREELDLALDKLAEQF